MVSVPVLSGVSVDGVDFRTAYPQNLTPVPKATGISQGYLKPADGILTVVSGGSGVDRGGFNWNDTLYRVNGSNLISITAEGVVTTIGSVGGTVAMVTFDKSFDHLAICSSGDLYMYDGTTLTQVVDVDLGTSLDVIWINGRFVSTDGEVICCSDVGDPFTWSPLNYASSEISPDPIRSLVKLRNEIYAVNRYTTEIFSQIINPGSAFPFARVDGAQIMKGCVGRKAACEFMQRVAMLGGGENEAPAVWLAGGGDAVKISTREIDNVLRAYTESDLVGAAIEARADLGHEFLYVHLSDQTLVYDGAASQAFGEPIWFVLKSGVPAARYRAWGLVWVYNAWWVGDPTTGLIGTLTDTVSSHWGDLNLWEFTTAIAYNSGQPAQVHQLELVALTGNVDVTDNPVLATQWTVDGVTWSMPKYIRAGRFGERNKRLVWDRQGEFRKWRGQRFNGDSRAHLTFATLELQVEPLQ